MSGNVENIKAKEIHLTRAISLKNSTKLDLEVEIELKVKMNSSSILEVSVVTLCHKEILGLGGDPFCNVSKSLFHQIS